MSVDGFDLSPLRISLAIAGAATLLLVVAGVLAGRLMMGRRGWLAGLADAALLMPLVLPPTVVGHGLLLLFGVRGPLGAPLAAAGVRIAFAPAGAVLAAAVCAFPFMYQAARAGFEQVPVESLQAARALGAGEAEILRRILIPMARPALLAGLLLGFARALGEFGATMMLAGNIPGKTRTLPVAVFFAVEAGHDGEALGYAALSAALSLAAVLALNLWVRRGTRRAG